MMMRDDMCCPTCKAPRLNGDGTYNIVVSGRDRNGNTRFKCKRCPGASRFVLQPPCAAGSAADDDRLEEAGAAALPANTPPEAAAGGSGTTTFDGETGSGGTEE